MNTRSSLMLLFLTILSSLLCAQEVGALTDSRDGQTYKVLTFDFMLEGDVAIQRTWMAQNLNYETEDSFCYKNEKAYCEVYGRLYTFHAAREACMEGWHVPTIAEWNLLFAKYGGIREAGLALQNGGDSQMNLRSGGFGDPGRVFKNIGISGNYWDAEKKSSNISGLISLQRGSKKIYHSVIGDWYRNSCRCIKDY